MKEVEGAQHRTVSIEHVWDSRHISESLHHIQPVGGFTAPFVQNTLPKYCIIYFFICDQEPNE